MPKHTVSFGSDLFEFNDDVGDNALKGRNWIQPSVSKNINFDREHLSGLFEHSELKIPEYQRGYEWQEQQWEDLWVELEPVFTEELSRSDLTEVFFGSIFTADVDNTTAEIIDGQQRITTVSIILKILQELLNEISDIQGSENDNISEVATSQRVLMKRQFYKNPGVTNPTPKVVLNDHNNPFYKALMQNDEAQLSYITERNSVHGNRKRNAINIDKYAELLRIDEETLEGVDEDNRSFNNSNKKLLNAYDYFRSKIEQHLRDLFETPAERSRAIINLKRYLMNAFIVGHFHVTEGHPSLLMDIFQILNDRGMDLGQIDIIRARIVARLREDANEDTEQEYLGYWKSIVELFDGNHSDVNDFLVDTLTATSSNGDTRSDISDLLLEVFVLNPRDTQTLDSRLKSLASTQDLLETLSEYSKYYHNIIYPYDDGMKLESDSRERQCNDILQRLQTLRTGQWRPLILAIYAAARRSDATEQAEKFLLRTMKSVENITFRQILTNINPNQIETIYAQVINEFSSSFETTIMINIRRELYERFEEKYDGVVGSTFAETLIENSSLNSRYGKAILWKLTEEQDSTDGMWRQSLNIEQVHLEHFFPQSPLLTNTSSYDRYYWFSKFFTIKESDSKLSELIDNIIDSGDDELLLNIAEEYYIDDIGNMGLLWHQDNITGQNHPLSRKLPIYQNSDFANATVNTYFAEDNFSDETIAIMHKWAVLKTALKNPGNWEEHTEKLSIECTGQDEFERKASQELERIEEQSEYEIAIAEFDTYWTYETLIDRKSNLLEDIFDLLSFDYEQPNGEWHSELSDDFSGETLRQKVREEMESRARVVVAENSNYLPDE